MRRLLLLGAGNAQIDAIEYCKKNGIEVFGCSYTNDDKGIPLLDDFKQIDIKDFDGVRSYAEEAKVDAVYSIGSDLAMPTVMKVSEDLSLPHFISYDTARTCHSKDLFRKALGSDFPGNAPFVVGECVGDLESFNDYPAMMKPVDSQGQRGCFKVDSFKEVREKFEDSLSFSVEGRVILEKYITGPEISVNGYFQDGELRIAVISDRISFDEYPGGIIKEHRVPSTFAGEKSKEQVMDLVKRIGIALDYRQGPVYCQIKLDEEGSPFVLEVAPRLDGCHMWDLVKHYTGADLLDACFRHLLWGEQVLTDEYDYSKQSYALTFLCKETGATFNRNEYDIRDAEKVLWYYETGDTVGRVNGIMEKGGYVIRRIG